MILLIIKPLLIALAAICNAVMDTCREHYDISIFSKYACFNKQFWDASISWLNKYAKFPQTTAISRFYKIPLVQSFSDAWHLFKSIMILSLCTALALTAIDGFFIASIVLYGTVWNLSFNLFYNNLLRK
jgi:hypothetical protein